MNGTFPFSPSSPWPAQVQESIVPPSRLDPSPNPDPNPVPVNPTPLPAQAPPIMPIHALQQQQFMPRQEQPTGSPYNLNYMRTSAGAPSVSTPAPTPAPVPVQGNAMGMPPGMGNKGMDPFTMPISQVPVGPAPSPFAAGGINKVATGFIPSTKKIRVI